MTTPYYITACGATLLLALSIYSWYRGMRRDRDLVSRLGGAGAVEYRYGRIIGLYVTGRDFSGSEMRKLTALKHLRELQIDHASVHAEDLTVLDQLPRLQVLWLYDRSLGDSAIERLTNVHQLTVLGIRLSQMTERGLQLLENFKKLKHLRIGGRDFGVESIGNLRRALPGCYIEVESD